MLCDQCFVRKGFRCTSEKTRHAFLIVAIHIFVWRTDSGVLRIEEMCGILTGRPKCAKAGSRQAAGRKKDRQTGKMAIG